MNRLALARRVQLEAGLHGTPIETTEGTLSGIDEKIVGWVDEAWKLIQQHNWHWLWQATTVTVSANTYYTAGSIPASRYVLDGTYDPNGSPLVYVRWEVFRQDWPAVLIAAGNPRFWTIRPDYAFAVNAKPSSDTAYTVERYTNPTAMSTDAGTPTGMPSEHHMAIVWRAVMLYAGFDDAPEVYRHAAAEYRKACIAMGGTSRPTMAVMSDW